MLCMGIIYRLLNFFFLSCHPYSCCWHWSPLHCRTVRVLMSGRPYLVLSLVQFRQLEIIKCSPLYLDKWEIVSIAASNTYMSTRLWTVGSFHARHSESRWREIYGHWLVILLHISVKFLSPSVGNLLFLTESLIFDLNLKSERVFSPHIRNYNSFMHRGGEWHLTLPNDSYVVHEMYKLLIDTIIRRPGITLRW